MYYWELRRRFRQAYRNWRPIPTLDYKTLTKRFALRCTSWYCACGFVGNYGRVGSNCWVTGVGCFQKVTATRLGFKGFCRHMLFLLKCFSTVASLFAKCQRFVLLELFFRSSLKQGLACPNLLCSFTQDRCSVQGCFTVHLREFNFSSLLLRATGLV